MKKIAPRCDEIVIFIIFVRRQRFRRDVFLLVLSTEWMGMGEWDYFYSYCGSFPHSLLSTSKFFP